MNLLLQLLLVLLNLLRVLLLALLKSLQMLLLALLVQLEFTRMLIWTPWLSHGGSGRPHTRYIRRGLPLVLTPRHVNPVWASYVVQPILRVYAQSMTRVKSVQVLGQKRGGCEGVRLWSWRWGTPGTMTFASCNSLLLFLLNVVGKLYPQLLLCHIGVLLPDYLECSSFCSLDFILVALLGVVII